MLKESDSDTDTVDCKFCYDENELCVELPQEKCARLFEIDLK